MLLQEARRDGIGHLAFHGPLDDRRLVLTKRHNGDFAGFENGADAHGQGLGWDVLFPVKIGGRIAPGHRVERYLSGTAMPRGTRLIEADVAGPADAEDLQIDT